MKEEKSEIETYLEAVSNRKSISRKTTSPRVNFAIIVQLEEKDVPLLIDLVRAQTRALEAIVEMFGADSDDEQLTEVEEEMFNLCHDALTKSIMLARAGSKARWGGAEDVLVH